LEDLMFGEVVKMLDGYFLFVFTLKFIFIACDWSGWRTVEKMWVSETITMIFLIPSLKLWLGAKAFKRLLMCSMSRPEDSIHNRSQMAFHRFIADFVIEIVEA
jgi:hypothetical protein